MGITRERTDLEPNLQHPHVHFECSAGGAGVWSGTLRLELLGLINFMKSSLVII